MFKLKGKLLLLPFLAILLAAVFPFAAYAAQFEKGDYILETEFIVEDDLYIAGDNVMIRGVVDGDLIIFGQNVTVDGTVTGDLYAFGNTVSIAGSIYGNVLALGSNVSLKGTLGQNVYVGSMMVDIDANIGKDLNIASGTTKIAGSVGDDVRVATGQLSSDASVAGDFLISSESFNIAEEKISGELVISTKETKISQTPKFEFRKGDFLGFNLGLAMVSFVGMYIVGLLLIYIAPVKTLAIERKITTSWEELLKSFAIGLVILFAIPLPLFILVLTLVGAPLAFLITAVLVFLVTFGTLWTEAAVGHKILTFAKQKDERRFLSLLVGRLITVVMKLIPFIGTLYSLILGMVTVGAVARMKYDAFQAGKDVKKKK